MKKKSFYLNARSRNGGGEIHTNRTLGELDFARKLRKLVDELIKSNERLSKAQGRYALALNILTAALVFVGLLNLFST